MLSHMVVLQGWLARHVAERAAVSGFHAGHTVSERIAFNRALSGARPTYFPVARPLPH
jgi:hypothetical protein